MKRTLFVACLSVVALAGCGRTVVRETEVVREPVVTRETVIEQPAPETIVTGPAACAFAGNAYSTGTFSCQAGYQYQCNDGVWERVANTSC
jgi:hypothetical protein